MLFRFSIFPLFDLRWVLGWNLPGVGAASAQITREGIVPQPPLVHPSSRAVVLFVFVFVLLLLRGWPPTDIASILLQMSLVSLNLTWFCVGTSITSQGRRIVLVSLNLTYDYCQ